jgi:hypothetical protein
MIIKVYISSTFKGQWWEYPMKTTGLFYWDVCGQDRRLLYYYNKGPPKGFLIMVSLFTTHAVIHFSFVTLFPWEGLWWYIQLSYLVSYHVSIYVPKMEFSTTLPLYFFFFFQEVRTSPLFSHKIKKYKSFC